MTDPILRYIRNLALNESGVIDERSVAIGFAAGVDAVARTVEEAATLLSGAARDGLMAYAREMREKVRWPNTESGRPAPSNCKPQPNPTIRKY